jgi:hypothetical protein
VMPDRSNDDGFMIPCHSLLIEGEGFIEPGQVRRPARQIYIQGFREERLRINMIPCINS